jgi:hypothetical protein
MTTEPKLLSRATNFAVVQLPSRNFPGVVVQGDTLNSLVSSLADMKSQLQAGDYAELVEEIEEMRAQLGEALSHYEEVCRRLAVELPYPKK